MPLRLVDCERKAWSEGELKALELNDGVVWDEGNPRDKDTLSGTLACNNGCLDDVVHHFGDNEPRSVAETRWI